jgi:hypothetical protein
MVSAFSSGVVKPATAIVCTPLVSLAVALVFVRAGQYGRRSKFLNPSSPKGVQNLRARWALAA